MSEVRLYDKSGRLKGVVDRPIGPTPTPQASPATWAELHCYVPVGDERDVAWLAAFSARVHGIGCNCRAHWRAWCAAHPPPLRGTAAEWFGWTVDAHNAVNGRLGKAEISLGEAYCIWTVDGNGGTGRTAGSPEKGGVRG